MKALVCVAVLAVVASVAAAEETSAPAGTWRLDKGTLVLTTSPPASTAVAPLTDAQCNATWDDQLKERETCVDAVGECRRLWNAFLARETKCASRAAAASSERARSARRELRRWDYRSNILKCLRESEADKKVC